MKRKRTLVFAVVLTGALFAAPCQQVYASPEDWFLFIDMITGIGSNIVETAKGVQEMVQQTAMMAAQTMRDIKNLTSGNKIMTWDEAMKWMNREEYVWNETEQRYKKETYTFTIGNTSKELTQEEIDQFPIPAPYQAKFPGRDWTKDFSEEELQDAWLNTGMTLENYICMKKNWDERRKHEKELAIKHQIIREENEAAFKRSEEIAKRVNDDHKKSEDERMGEKELGGLQLEIQLDTNRAIRNMAYDNARYQEYVSKQYQRVSPPMEVKKSPDWYATDIFKPLK